MDTSHALIEQTENLFLEGLISLLESDSITDNEARQASKDFLVCVDGDGADFPAKLKEFVEGNEPFGPLYTQFLNLQEQEKTSTVLAKMKTLMKQGNIDEALEVAQNK